ncbi:MAG: N(4)-(beta-N-acetylglucosaminyl)-L-asparaginase [Flavobacteriales bacterium]
MQKSRRYFLSKSLFGFASFSLLAACGLGTKTTPVTDDEQKNKEPLVPYIGGLVLSTWDAGLKANAAAMLALQAGGNALDMAEKGVNDTEADFSNLSVGLGGLPDREGHTTLDACIMDSHGNAGSVMFLEKIKHPASVARRVMEKTPHVQLAGEGAFQFALAEGFPQDDFVSDEARAAYQKWLKESLYKPIVNIENHDTIGLLAMDTKGDISGSCTTSGLAYKMRGRVGDSPIIGAGLYVDNEVGAATSTGLGEAVIKVCGSFLVVELMRGGATPQEACEEAVKRVQLKNANYKEIQVGFLAINKAGEIGAYALQKGFTYALHKDGENKVYPSGSLL